MNELVAAMASNEVLGGVMGGSLVLSVLYSLRSLPAKIGSWLVWQFTCEVEVHSENSAFEVLEAWLSEHEYAARSRRLRLTASYSEHEQREGMQLAPGLGTHLLWHRARPVLVKRTVPKDEGASYRRRENFSIQTIGRSPKPLRDLVSDIVEAQAGSRSRFIEIYLYAGYWRLASRKHRRDLASVVLPTEQRERIVSDLDRFVASREWYARHGIPYRRGLLLHGPPGCGKTSLVLALASHLSRRVYALNLGSLANDEALIDAVSSVPESAILLIEDIDAAQRDRRNVSAKPKEKGETRPVTMSALLNCLDGVFARDGRILVMTTNHIERIDPALDRPGRADRRERIGELGPDEVQTMCDMFGRCDVARRVRAPVAAAELQRELIAMETVI